MADHTDSARVSDSHLNRRGLMALLAGCLTAATGTVAVVAAQQPSPSRPDFSSVPFNASAYVDWMIAGGLECYLELRGERIVGLRHWLPENLGGDPKGEKVRAFEAELMRRGFVFHLEPGERYRENEDRRREFARRNWV